MASGAEFPGRIEKLIKDLGYGRYAVNITSTGAKKTVYIDDYFPCYQNNTPIFSKNHGKELWVLIMEKAWAKLHGSYKRIEWG